jgi:hypothetical protein
MENHSLQRQTTTRKIGLVDLLAMTAFVTPIVATISTVKHSAGGFTQYLLAVPLGIALGALIVSLEWMLGRVIWLRFENHSGRFRHAAGLGLYVIQLFWIFVGAVGGDKLGALVVSHIPR